MAATERADALAATGRELNDLHASLHASSSTAAVACAALQAAHKERERALWAAKMVNDLLGLEECADDVESALSRGDYSAAVMRVAPLAKAIAATDLDLGSDAKRATAMVNSLRQRVSSELSKATASSSDVGAVCSLAKLTPALGRADEGRAALTEFSLRQLEEAAALPEAPRDGSSAPPVATLVCATLGRVLQRCAALLESADDALGEEAGGTAARRELAIAVRQRCVALGTELGGRFTAAAALKSLVEDASRRLQHGGAAAGGLVPSGAAVESTDDAERAALACEARADEMASLIRGAIQWDMYTPPPSCPAPLSHLPHLLTCTFRFLVALFAYLSPFHRPSPRCHCAPPLGVAGTCGGEPVATGAHRASRYATRRPFQKWRAAWSPSATFGRSRTCRARCDCTRACRRPPRPVRAQQVRRARRRRRRVHLA